VVRRTFWFWLCIAYLVFTVTYNVWTQIHSISERPVVWKVGLAVNLGCKVPAVGLLICRRVEGLYLLIVAFAVGLATTLWGYATSHDWQMLPLSMKIGRVDGFIISLAIIIYMALWMSRDSSITNRPSRDRSKVAP
jgi:hypothetical protein